MALQLGNTADVAAVVISHDCDLAQPSEIEPVVEVIVGRFIDGPPNGNFTQCKNLRRLHLECSAGTTTCVVELEAVQRRSIPKDTAVAGVAGIVEHIPCTAHSMTGKERNTLQLWLAARYRRAAFPDEFDRRLKHETSIAAKLAKAFKDSGRHIRAVFFDVDEGNEVTRQGLDDAYQLFVTLLYSTEDDPSQAKAAATIAAKNVEDIFRSCCFVGTDGDGTWKWIELLGVDAISDEDLTFAQSLQLKKWQADHISLRNDAEQPMLD
jgi:hypothetical protein